jgi:futalosine hydrolase
MKLLVVAATEAEIGIFRSRMPHITTLVTGVGMVATTYALMKHLTRHRYDLVLQAGVSGSFDRTVPLGSLVHVVSDRFGDLGAEDHDQYIDIFDLGLLGSNDAPYTHGMLVNPLGAVHQHITLPQVSGITVNSVTGSAATVAIRQQYGCTTESMEGAALHFVCLSERVTFAQVRAISNYVEPRDKGKWQMKEAIIDLNDWLISFATATNAE